VVFPPLPALIVLLYYLFVLEQQFVLDKKLFYEAGRLTHYNSA